MADFPSPPNFSAQLDPNNFQVQGGDALKQGLGQANAGIQNTNFDWSHVNDLLGQLAGQQDAADARAMGQGLTAGAAARQQQTDLGAVGNDPASLGKALMHLGSKMSSNQAGQVGQAQEQQQMGAMNQAAQLRQAQAQSRLDIYKKELKLQDQKFQIAQNVQKAKDGLAIFNLQLKNMFNSSVANAKNAQDLGQIAVQHDRFNQSLGYVQAILGAGSSFAASGADLLNQGKAQTQSPAAPAAPPAPPTSPFPTDTAPGSAAGMADFYGVQP